MHASLHSEGVRGREGEVRVRVEEGAVCVCVPVAFWLKPVWLKCFSKQHIQKGDDSWCAMSSFCIGGEFVYTELWGRSSANEPVLYMIRHNGASVCVRCLGHDFDEWELPSSPMMMMMMMMSMIPNGQLHDIP